MTNNYMIKKLTGFFAAALALAAFAVMPALAQGQPIQAQPVEVRINPNRIKLNRRPPIPFKPFEMRDPKTGQPISPTTTITLPNGNQMTAQQYYAELKRLELRFNAIGRSLRDQRQRDELQRLVTDQSALQRQIQKMRADNPQMAAPVAPGSMELSPQALQRLAKGHEDEVRKDAQRASLLGDVKSEGKPRTINTVKSFNYTLGDNSIFAAFVNGKLDLTGTKDLTTVNGEANAGGSILGNRQNILRVIGQATAPKTGTMNGKLTFTVLGTNVFNLDQNTNASLSKSGSLTKPFDFSASTRFTIGPIPVKVKVGAKGSAGVAYFVGLRPIAAKASLSPTVNASVYAQAGVDILIASAGVGAEMTLIDSKLGLGGEIAIQFEAGKPIFFENVFACVDLHFLKGEIYVFYEVFPFGGDEMTLWDFDGFHTTACLFNITKKTDLFEPPVLTQGSQVGMVK